MSFAILRTNVGLTTNIKIMVTNNYQLSLDSIESNSKLSLSRFKRFKFNKSTLYDDIIPVYYKDTPTENSYYIKYNGDSNLMSDSFSEQFDDLYMYGAKNIINNKDYSEEFEYFAPLYFDEKMPKNFIIFRIDGTGIENINRNNFKNNIINKFKVVKLFDLTNKTPLGEWLDINFTRNSYFPKSPLEIDFRNLEFSRWNGIDYETGGYTSKSFFMDNILENEKEIFELEKFVFNNFKSNKLVFPNILNLSFLFDDTPATPEVLKKWSLNRYYGFYLDDMELSYTISPYKPPSLREDVIILDNNIIFSESNPNNPFIEEWIDDKPFYVEYRGEYFIVERYSETRGDKIMDVQDVGFINEEYQTVIVNFYKIISNLDLKGEQDHLNINSGYIEDDTLIFDNVDYSNNFNDDFDTADIWVIEIDGLYHKLVKQDNLIKINSDYEFKFSEEGYEYRVAGESKEVETLVDFENRPKKLNIFKCKLSDIKDFDTKIVDTEFSKFEYEKRDEITETDETKMYLYNLSSVTNPKSLDDFIFKNKVVNIPTSSEYTANFETFKIDNNGLSDIWRTNSVYCRWGFKNSLSANDYPYLLNNSNIFEVFNRTVNPFESLPNRRERNLDYFYTINSSTSSYVHHSLHVENVIDGEIDVDFKFDEDKYLGLTSGPSDYFTFFFERANKFDKSRINKNIKKYSKFNLGEPSVPNITLFRGIEFRIYDVDSIQIGANGSVDSINLINSNNFDNYKFSIILTENDNGMRWNIIESWRTNTEYKLNSTVVFEDILYTALVDNITTNPSLGQDIRTAPYNLTSSWTYSTPESLGISQSILWSPVKEYNEYDYVYNSNNYYFVSSTSSNIDFWNPKIAQSNGGYLTSSIVLFKGEYWQSMTSSNVYPPDYKSGRNVSFQEFEGNILNSSGLNTKEAKYWKRINKPSNTKWSELEIWNPSSVYIIDDSIGEKKLIFHKNTIWSATQSLQLGQEPGINTNWKREYSIKPDTNYIYNTSDNSMILTNNRYYIIKENPEGETLENGIVVYINKRWKNILINIRFNDNTLPNLSNSDRDSLYNDLYGKITAYNFISSLNEFYNNYNFTDYVKYVVIEKDGSINNYTFDNNIRNLPYLLAAYTPDDFNIRLSSLTKVGFKPRVNTNKILNNGNIDEISKLNWYNNIPISYTITDNDFREKPIINYSGLSEPINKIFRFTGQYSPIFYDIQLFDKNTENRLPGNYKFDTSLTEFGLIKELKFKKVNRSGSVLKLRNQTDNSSIYPMVDEFGYGFKDIMIFKSNWDLEYHIETSESKTEIINVDNTSTEIELPQNIGQSQIFKIQNSKKYNL